MSLRFKSPDVNTARRVHQERAETFARQVATFETTHPTSISLDLFIAVGMKGRIAAGDCIVTCSHRLFPPIRLIVVDVYVEADNPVRPHIIVTEDGNQSRRFGSVDSLDVQWIDGKLCHKCGERWPETSEYFYRARRGGGLRSPCKACIAEKKQKTNASTPCCVPGCTNPRNRRKSGLYDHRCYEHRYHVAVRKEKKV